MTHPFLDESLEIKWTDLAPGNVREDMAEAMRRADAALETIRALNADKADYLSTFAALEDATEIVSRPWAKVNHLEEVADSPELREAYNAVLPEVSAFFARIPLDQRIWRALRAARDNGACNDPDPVRRRFASETIKDFIEAGADLPEGKRTELEAIQTELSAFTQKYSENVLDATNAFELVVTDPARLGGLPPHAREAARRDALDHGQGSEEHPQWRFTLRAPSFIPAMQYLDDDNLRRQLYTAYTNIGREAPHDNSALVWQILELRQRKARILGKPCFADLTTARRMAGSGRAALAFVEDMHDRIAPAFAREIQELERFKAVKTGSAPTHLEPWQTTYWMEKLRRERYDFDDELLRPYFPIDSVIGGMFRICETLFGLEIREKTGADKPDVWHPETHVYDIFDSASGRKLCTFYADWHPRPSKRGGAWMEGLYTGRTLPDGSREPHAGIVCGNLTAAQGDSPALLTHGEVETIFHEFGHLLHHALGEVSVRSLSGTNVAWDFVEMPSQIMENWTWEREGLDLFARHYKTGETIPQELFARMTAARQFGAARAAMRQLSFGKMDLELHINYERDKGGDLDTVVAHILEGYLQPTNTPAPNNVRNFNHLFSSATGYAAGYYSYKWAEVLDADAFTRFAREGVLNPKVGREFRDKILAKGNSEQPARLFRDFLGRDPDPDALLRRDGIIA
jgi:oligopeptidase A